MQQLWIVDDLTAVIPEANPYNYTTTKRSNTPHNRKNCKYQGLNKFSENGERFEPPPVDVSKKRTE